MTSQPWDFYGGAIRGLIPQGWLDASDLRQVPDHQEIFLSPTTLSNQIIELNELVTRDTLSTLPATATQEDTDKAAALYHLYDLRDIAAGDTLEILSGPERVQLGKLGSSPDGTAVRAYKGSVALTTREERRRGSVEIAGGGGGGGISIGGAAAGSSAEGALTRTVHCYYLLVRVEEKGTDLLVCFNVPRKEFEEKGDSRGLKMEEEFVERVRAGLMERLEVVDWGLFN